MQAFELKFLVVSAFQTLIVLLVGCHQASSAKMNAAPTTSSISWSLLEDGTMWCFTGGEKTPSNDPALRNRFNEASASADRYIAQHDLDWGKRFAALLNNNEFVLLYDKPLDPAKNQDACGIEHQINLDLAYNVVRIGQPRM